ncbi:microfibril-associated protein [Babesia gibsoni]|uniref:Microfibril-associated protein n=1 Tax=Babesia gibsoni TaxID=33632 RepID=A0AAD8LP57_BABGI|nr:microfibril-associated protein [Babesia gibsoni]
MSALELFRFLGEDLNRPPSPQKDIVKRRKKVQSQPTTRYWPGKAPEYAKDADYSSDESDAEASAEAAQAALENDRRYARYAKNEDTDDSKPVTSRRRARAATVTVERKQEPPETIDDKQIEDENTTSEPQSRGEVEQTAAPRPRNRAEIRSRAIAYRKEEESQINEKGEDESPVEDAYSDSDSDYEEHEEDQPTYESSNAFQKPLFVPKTHRMTLLEKQELERQEQKRLENERQRALERQKQSKELLVKTLVEEEAQQEVEDPINMVDDTDVMDEKEYEMWKIRELKRIIRDREERTAHDRLAAEVERRRNMTEEERMKDNERIDSTKVKKAPRSKLQFLQKYYHKGAFFMDKLEDGSEPVYNRDYNAPTADDRIDKSMLPKPMQVRRGMYGKVGQTKYTHLTAEDTTKFDMPWTKEAPKFTPAGTKNEFDRPSRKGDRGKYRN